jgi:hypothetical protein
MTDEASSGFDSNGGSMSSSLPAKSPSQSSLTGTSPASVAASTTSPSSTNSAEPTIIISASQSIQMSPNSSSAATTQDVQYWSSSYTFRGNYLPIIVARIFVLIFDAINRHLAEYEPLRQLGSPAGATGLVLAGTLVTLAPSFSALFVTQVGSAFSVEVVFLDTQYCGRVAADNGLNPCSPRLSTNSWILYILLVILVLVAITLIYLILLWSKPPHRMAKDPTSIAGIAAIMGHPKSRLNS